MNIWLIQTGEPLPTDIQVKKMRTALLADKLIAKGHTVLWWTSAFDHIKKKWLYKTDTEVAFNSKLKIFAIKGTGYKKNISLSRFIDHRIVARKFRRNALRFSLPDIIIASTPPYDLAYEAVLFANEHNIPVLVDIRDEWPDLFLTMFPNWCRKTVKFVLQRDFHMIHEVTRRSDGLISMMDSLLDWGLACAQREKSSNDRVFYLGAEKMLNNTNQNPKSTEISHHKFIVTFVGTFVHNNDPSILIECAKRLKEHDIFFVIAGNGELFDEIKTKTSTMKNVWVPGWLNYQEMNALLRQSHLGVCPTVQDRAAFPNKIFSYFAAGLPVITSFRGNLKDIVERNQIGLYYPPNDIEALTECIRRLYQDKNMYQSMSQNVRVVFDELFDADKIYGNYADHILRLAGSH